MPEDYKIVGNNITICNQIMCADIATWIEGLDNISRSFSELANNTQFTGNCANKVKGYLYDTYVGETNIPQLLIATMQAMSDRMVLYEKRMLEYDGVKGYLLNRAKMEEYRETINRSSERIHDTNDLIGTLLGTIADI